MLTNLITLEGSSSSQTHIAATSTELKKRSTQYGFDWIPRWYFCLNSSISMVFQLWRNDAGDLEDFAWNPKLLCYFALPLQRAKPESVCVARTQKSETPFVWRLPWPLPSQILLPCCPVDAGPFGRNEELQLLRRETSCTNLIFIFRSSYFNLFRYFKVWLGYRIR